MKVSNEMVQRFLGWRLPDDFYPDGGVTFNREVNGGLRPKTWWPVGTNLLTDPQAWAMLEHVVGPEFDALLARCEAVEARLAEAERLLRAWDEIDYEECEFGDYAAVAIDQHEFDAAREGLDDFLRPDGVDQLHSDDAAVDHFAAAMQEPPR